MQREEAYHWLQQGERRQRILLSLKQPMTAKQLEKSTGLDIDHCSEVVAQLLLYELVKCLNPSARRSRLYWLTEIGKECQGLLRQEQGLEPQCYDFPQVDWDVYGWVCYSHRTRIILTISRTMQPSQIKRKARFENVDVRMSANNVRDIIKLFLKRGIVFSVKMRKKKHPWYELTELGKKLRELLQRASTPA